jgi:hypothetical protein
MSRFNLPQGAIPARRIWRYAFGANYPIVIRTRNFLIIVSPLWTAVKIKPIIPKYKPAAFFEDPLDPLLTITHILLHSTSPTPRPPNPRSQDEVDANAGTGGAECVGPGGGTNFHCNFNV